MPFCTRAPERSTPRASTFLFSLSHASSSPSPQPRSSTRVPGSTSSPPIGKHEPIRIARDVEVRIRVEAVDELLPAIVEVALYFKLIRRPHAPPPFSAHPFVAHVRNVSHLSRPSSPPSRRSPAVVLPAV